MPLTFAVPISGIPARVAYQTRSRYSFISSEFLAEHALAVVSGRSTLSISVPTTTGYFTSTAAFLVFPQSDLNRLQGGVIDAVLGLDWLGSCLAVASASDGSISFLSSTAESQFQASRSGSVFPPFFVLAFSHFVSFVAFAASILLGGMCDQLVLA